MVRPPQAAVSKGQKMKKQTTIEPNKRKFKKCEILKCRICVRYCEYSPRDLQTWLRHWVHVCTYVLIWFELSVESITRPNIRKVQYA